MMKSSPDASVTVSAAPSANPAEGCLIGRRAGAGFGRVPYIRPNTSAIALAITGSRILQVGLELRYVEVQDHDALIRRRDLLQPADDLETRRPRGVLVVSGQTFERLDERMHAVPRSGIWRSRAAPV